MNEREANRRYLDYRETYGYFARGERCLSLAEFTACDAELAALTAKESLDDEEDARREELEKILYRD